MSETPEMPETPETPEMPETPEPIAFEDFAKLDLRVARVLDAKDHPNADKLLVLQIDLGTEKRQIIAGLKGHYEPSELVGKSIVVVSNLAPRKMRGEISQGMLLAASSEDREQVRVLLPDGDLPPGSSVS